MQRQTRRPAARAAVSVLAAAALLVSLMAAPASAADNPANTDIMGLLKGGYISLGTEKPATPENSDHYFPLGEKNAEESICDKEDPRSHVLANDVDANGSSTDLEFNLAQGTTGIKGVIFFFIPYEVCVKLKVLNAANLVMETDGKAVSVHEPPKINNVGPLVEVQFRVKNQNNGNNLAVCRTTPQLAQMTGEWAPPKDQFPGKQQHDWNLTLKNSQKIAIPAVVPESGGKYNCDSLVAGIINSSSTGLGLPRADGNLEMKFAVYDCNLKDCSKNL